MSVPLFNHSEIYQLLYNGNTTQAIKAFVEKTFPDEFTPFLRNAYLSSLNFGIYNSILLKENISLHECCMENEKKILKSTNTSFLEIGTDIISSYGNDSRYMVEKYKNPHIKTAVTYIHRHLSEPLSLEIVSDAVCINPAYLSELFMQEVHINFCDYVNMQRIKTAKNLLRNTSLSIQDIADRCGYKSVSYFSTCFKRYVGEKPSHYRRLDTDKKKKEGVPKVMKMT